MKSERISPFWVGGYQPCSARWLAIDELDSVKGLPADKDVIEKLSTTFAMLHLSSSQSWTIDEDASPGKDR